jgi:tripartite-type tricarboxylate transporter receptor subunit TctC
LRSPISRHLLRWLTAALALTGAAVSAQPYPARPITLVVPFGAGSGTDQVARAFSQAIAAELPAA